MSKGNDLFSIICYSNKIIVVYRHFFCIFKEDLAFIDKFDTILIMCVVVKVSDKSCTERQIAILSNIDNFVPR